VSEFGREKLAAFFVKVTWLRNQFEMENVQCVDYEDADLLPFYFTAFGLGTV